MMALGGETPLLFLMSEATLYSLDSGKNEAQVNLPGKPRNLASLGALAA